MTRTTNQLPERLTEFRVPQKGVIGIFKNKTSDGGAWAAGLLSAVVAILSLKFRPAIQTVCIGYIVGLFCLFSFYAHNPDLNKYVAKILKLLFISKKKRLCLCFGLRIQKSSASCFLSMLIIFDLLSIMRYFARRIGIYSTFFCKLAKFYSILKKCQ